MEIRCQDCGGKVKKGFSCGEKGKCAVCGEAWTPHRAARTRARKKFELVVAMAGRPEVVHVENSLPGHPPAHPTLPAGHEIIAKADSILDTLYGPLKGEGDG